MTAPILAVRDLRFVYRTHHRSREELFDGLSYAFAPGAMTAVTGRSGRGKSTLLYLLGLLLTPTSGAVDFDGHPVSSLDDRRRSTIRCRTIGFVFQDAQLDPTRSILESVAEPGLYAGGATDTVRRRAAERLQELGLEHRASHRPGEISGGQAQRVAVCRALINDPRILLADEPTGNLDRDIAEHVLTALSRAASTDDCTVVIATHDPFVMDHTDHRLDL